MKKENIEYLERFRPKYAEYLAIQTVSHFSMEEREKLLQIYREEVDSRILVDLTCAPCFLDDLMVPLFNYLDMENKPFPDCLDAIEPKKKKGK